MLKSIYCHFVVKLKNDKKYHLEKIFPWKQEENAKINILS